MSTLHRLHELPPDDVASYLSASGWRQNGTYGRTTVWTRRDHDEGPDLLLPFSRELRDYPQRLHELVDTLADQEDRDPATLLQDLLEPRTDVQYVHTEPQTPSGSTPIHEGFKAVKGVHDLFLAAATTATLPTPPAVLPSNKPKQAWDFLKGVRLGQTMPGSYILRVETPINSGGADGSPPSRSVLQRLHQSISAVRIAAEQGVDAAIRDVDEHIDNGISANVCEAVHDIGGRDSNPFSFRFTWARAEPMTVPTPEVNFDGETIRTVRQLGERLRELPEFREAVVTGRVVELRRAQNRGSGTVTIDGTLVVGQRRTAERIAAELDAADYDQAVEAHLRALPLRVSGSLRTSGRQPVMQQVTSAELMVPKNDRPS